MMLYRKFNESEIVSEMVAFYRGLSNSWVRDSASLDLRYAKSEGEIVRRKTSSGALTFVANAKPNTYRLTDARADLVRLIESKSKVLHVKCATVEEKQSSSVDERRLKRGPTAVLRAGRRAVVVPEVIAEALISEALTTDVLLAGGSLAFVMMFDVVRLRRFPEMFPEDSAEEFVMDSHIVIAKKTEGVSSSSKLWRRLLGSASHICLVQERLGSLVVNHVRSTIYFGTVCSLLYQTLHALDVAWRWNAFRHGDFHSGNIATKRLKDPRLATANWLFCSPDGWRLVHPAVHQGYLAKIFDFGRSAALTRIFVEEDEEDMQNKILVASETFLQMHQERDVAECASADVCALFWSLAKSLGRRSLSQFQSSSTKSFRLFKNLVERATEWTVAREFAIVHLNEMFSGSEEENLQFARDDILSRSTKKYGIFVFSRYDVATPESAKEDSRKTRVARTISTFLSNEFYAGRSSLPGHTYTVQSALTHLLFRDYISEIEDEGVVPDNCVAMSWRAVPFLGDADERLLNKTCCVCGRKVARKRRSKECGDDYDATCSVVCDQILRGNIVIVSPIGVALAGI